MTFIKNYLGLILTVTGMLFAVFGQIITTKDNNQLEADKKKQLDSINNLGIENKGLTIANKKILEQTAKQMNNEAYFRGFPHSYIAKFFTDGSVFIFRQTKDGNVFKKSIANKNDIGFENIDVKVIVNESNKKSSSIEVIHKQTQLENGAILTNCGTTSSISMDSSDIGKMQVFSGLGLGNYPNAKSDYSRNYFRLVTIDDEGFTYAVGRAPK